MFRVKDLMIKFIPATPDASLLAGSASGSTSSRTWPSGPATVSAGPRKVGAALLHADLEAPKGASMPLFELEGWEPD